jgi:hypothetical protein
MLVSGAGKTRAIFDMAMHNKIFVTYIECMPAADEVERIKESFTKLTIERVRVEAKRIITLDFTARFST